MDALFPKLLLLTLGLLLPFQKRIAFYYAMVTSEDVETQRRGAVLIYTMLGKQRLEYSRHNVSVVASLQTGLPVRLSGIHVCIDNVKLRPLLDLATFILEKAIMIRIRHHFGMYLNVASWNIGPS